MDFKKLLLPFLIILLLISCNDSGEQKSEIYENEKDDVRVELTKINDFLIKEDSSAYIGRFRSAKYWNDYIVISDMLRPELFFITKDGRIEKKLKWAKGKGPGEISRIGNFEIIDGKIYISDIGNFRWSIFTIDGKFIKSSRPFHDPREKQVGKYSENANIMISSGNKIFVSIIEVKFFQEQYKSKSIAVLDTSLKIIKTFGLMDDIYRRYDIYDATAFLTADKYNNIYYSQMPTYYISKYDSSGKLIKTFGKQGSFKQINEDLPAYLPSEEIREKFLKFSVAGELFALPSGFILQQCTNLTEEFFNTRSLVDRNNFVKIYNLEGDYIKSDFRIKGFILTTDDEGYIYIYENDEPGNRRIGIYKLTVI